MFRGARSVMENEWESMVQQIMVSWLTVHETNLC